MTVRGGAGSLDYRPRKYFKCLPAAMSDLFRAPSGHRTSTLPTAVLLPSSPSLHAMIPGPGHPLLLIQAV